MLLGLIKLNFSKVIHTCNKSNFSQTSVKFQSAPKYCFDFGMNELTLDIGYTFDQLIPATILSTLNTKLKTVLATFCSEVNGKLCTSVTKKKFLKGKCDKIKKEAVLSSFVPNMFVRGVMKFIKNKFSALP